MNKESKTIYFFAKVGNLLDKPYGGGEVGNRRTMALQKDLDYKTFLISRYYNYQPKNLLVFTKMIFGELFSIMRLFGVLLSKNRKDSLVHISGFAGLYLPIEFLAVTISNNLGYKTIYEIRGGGIVDFYSRGNVIYKWLFKQTVRMADGVFSQGLENKELILSLGNQNFTYYPNYLEEEFIPKECPQKKLDSIQFVYLGRLSPSKNILLILQVANILCKRGVKMELHIIGDGEDYPDYVKKCKQYVAEHNLIETCHFHGKLQREDIGQYLTKSIFFIFPSEEKREGQSNALTEAMAFGCIPIASSQGYTRSILENDELIEDVLSADAYSRKIINIIEKAEIEKLSSDMFARISKNYTYKVIKEHISRDYKKIFGVA